MHHYSRLLCVCIAGILPFLARGDSPNASMPAFAKAVKAKVLFEASSAEAPYLRVYLRMTNLGNSDVNWCGSFMDVESHLLDAAGKDVPEGASAASIISGRQCFLLPPGSRLDWMISHGGMSGTELKDSYILEVGGHRWLIPIKTADSYSLQVRLHGTPWVRNAFPVQPRKLLLDLPPQKIVISPGQ